jgi:hypothetical protein
MFLFTLVNRLEYQIRFKKCRCAQAVIEKSGSCAFFFGNELEAGYSKRPSGKDARQ